ncbi:MAG: hypothetical protein ACRDH2_05040, partial [Anaerolineales bacterium]
VMIAVDFGGELFDDWQIDEVRRLLDWLIAKTDLPDPERLWWLWHITMHSEPPHICKALAEWVLAHPALPAASKHALCEAWLADAWAGQPPAQWAAMQALLQGDAEAFAAHATSAGLPIPEGLPTRDAIEADYDFALDALLDGEGEVDEAPLLSLHMLRKMLIGPLGFVSITPSALKRAGVVALPRLGEDPLAVCQKYIATNSNYYADTFNLAVAELIRTYYTRMPQHEVRALVEHGLKVGSAPVRKTYYQLGAEMYGEEFMARAAHDNARSVREWAAKKASGPAKRGRKPKAERRT